MNKQDQTLPPATKTSRQEANQPQHTSIHIGHEVQRELLRQSHSAQWLSEQLHCNRTNIYNIFGRESIGTNLLMNISLVLQHDFFAIFSEEYTKQNDKCI